MVDNPILYSIDSFFMLACMVCMFLELFYFQMQYRFRIAKGKETPANTRRALFIASGVILVLQILLSTLQIPIRPAYLFTVIVPAFFFRFGMYEEGVYFFGHRYPWGKISQCQVVSAQGTIQIHYVTAKGKSFDLTYRSEYQDYILQLLQSKGFIPSEAHPDEY